MARGTVLAAAVAAVCAALLLAASGTARGIKEGGTFRVAMLVGQFTGIDPAVPQSTASYVVLNPACDTLMAYPDKPRGPGFRLAPSLAEAMPVVSRDRKTYTFTIRKDARFSTGAPVTARAFTHALERILTPAMQSGFFAEQFSDIVGAPKMRAGKATRLAGAIAKGRTLTLLLTKPVPDLLERLTNYLCPVPPNLPADPEGAKAPLASPGPYYVSEYVPNERLVLKRNRFYRGDRPQHVARFVADLAADPGAVDQVADGTFDTLVPPGPIIDRAGELAQRYGVNKSQFFVQPGNGLRLFVLNTSGPLFRNNVKLRQAVNFAIDRRAIVRQAGLYAERPTDQYLLPGAPGYRNERIYPLKRPDLRRAKALARGHTRGGKAVLYTADSPVDGSLAQNLKQNLRVIGLELEIEQFPTSVLFDKLATPGEPFDLGRIRWFLPTDPGYLSDMFDSRTIGRPEFGNWSSFNSPRYNRLLRRASRLTGEARYLAYGDLDVQLSRDAAPAVAASLVNALAFVSPRVGCVVLNPFLDLTAVCLR